MKNNLSGSIANLCGHNWVMSLNCYCHELEQGCSDIDDNQRQFGDWQCPERISLGSDKFSIRWQEDKYQQGEKLRKPTYGKSQRQRKFW